MRTSTLSSRRLRKEWEGTATFRGRRAEEEAREGTKNIQEERERTERATSQTLKKVAQAGRR